jgi:hypothetical protein
MIGAQPAEHLEMTNFGVRFRGPPAVSRRPPPTSKQGLKKKIHSQKTT